MSIRIPTASWGGQTDPEPDSLEQQRARLQQARANAAGLRPPPPRPDIAYIDEGEPLTPIEQLRGNLYQWLKSPLK